MQNPNIKKGNFYIIYSDFNTGILLNEDGSYFDNTKFQQNYFKEFVDKKTAIEFAKQKLSEFEEMEILIYDSLHQLVSNIINS